MSYKIIQRHLARIKTDRYRDAVAAKCFTHAAGRGTLRLLLYDVTTLHFGAENEDDLRTVGYSKGRRVDPQIFQHRRPPPSGYRPGRGGRRRR